MDSSAASDSLRPPVSRLQKPKRKGVPILAALAILAIFFQFNISLGGVILSPSRILFLIVTVPLAFRLLGGAYGRLVLADFLMVLFALWSTTAIFLFNPSVAVSFAGSQALALLGAYLVGRASIRSPEDFAALIRFLGIAVLVSLPFALFESITTRPLIMDILSRIPGTIMANPGLADPRFGLYRARVVFDVPIHYGLVCAMTFSLVFVGLRSQLGGVRHKAWGAMIGVATFLSVSSGPFLSLALQIGLVGWNWITRQFKGKWLLLICGFIVLYIVLELGSDRPALVAILSYITFNTQTLDLRVRLFEQGMVELGRSPLFGIGFNEWDLPPWMSGSVDNFWLLTAVAFGLPAFLFLFGSFIGSIIAASMRKFPAGSLVADLRLGWCLSIFSLMMTLATVAVWGQTYSLCVLVFASGMWLLTYEVPEEGPEGQDADPEADDTATLGSPYTRFTQVTRYRPEQVQAATHEDAPVRETRSAALLRKHSLQPTPQTTRTPKDPSEPPED